MLKKLGELFVSFARIGVLTIGGGYAMLPMMQNELVERRGWATEEEMMDYYALAQCTPGAIAVNVSTFIGYRLAGVAGGVVATLGLVFPSLVIITVIAAFLGNISELPAVKNAFAGIRVCVCVLIFNSVVKLGKKSVIDRWTLGIFLLILVLSLTLDCSPVVFVLVAALCGLAVKVLFAKGGETK